MLVMPIFINLLISNFQWRTTYLITGGMILACLVLGAQFLVKDPSQKQLSPDGREPVRGIEKVTGALNVPLGEAIHTRRFVALCVAYFSVFFCSAVTLIHIVPYTVDLGYSTSSSALVLAVIGGTSIAGRFILGTIGDRTGNKRAILLSFIILILGFIWLQFTERLWQLFVFAAVYGFAHGGLCSNSPVVAEFFGLQSHGPIFGVIVFAAR
jgi:nitrate/nitrite transporter NarK